MKEIKLENLYTENGLYLNMPAILALNYPYTIIISMRGGGKTYGFLRYALEAEERFIYFRRSKPALYMCADKDLHMFREINADTGRQIAPDMNSKTGLASFIDTDDGSVAGYAASLSTFASIRSIGSARAVGVDWLVFDECIPQPDERRTYDTFQAWQHAQETLIRNDEINGACSVRRLLMANADQIYGDIVEGYGIGDELLYMQENGIECAEHSEDTLILRPMCEGLRSLKENTSLYRSASGGVFNQVALSNEFTIRDRSDIKEQPLSEYIPFSVCGGICIYKHKSRQTYYVHTKASGKPKIYEDTDAGRRRFLRENSRVWTAYMRKHVLFSSLTAQMLFYKLYDIL